MTFYSTPQSHQSLFLLFFHPIAEQLSPPQVIQAFLNIPLITSSNSFSNLSRENLFAHFLILSSSHFILLNLSIPFRIEFTSVPLINTPVTPSLTVSLKPPPLNAITGVPT